MAIAMLVQCGAGEKCSECKKEIPAFGWKNGKVACEACALKKGWVKIFGGSGNPPWKHPWVNNPDLNVRGRFAMQLLSAKQPAYVQKLEPFTVTAKASEARLFSGGWLNVTNWHWSLGQKPVAEPEIKKLVDAERKAAKKAKK